MPTTGRGRRLGGWSKPRRRRSGLHQLYRGVWQQSPASVAAWRDWFLDQPQPGGGGGPAPWIDYGHQGSDGNPLTVAGLNIGTADTNRWIIAATVAPFFSATDFTGATIGGVSATLLTKDVSTEMRVAFWKANVPTGTTASVVVTANGTMWALAVAVAVCDGEPTLFDAEYDRTVSANTWEVNIDVPANGNLLAVHYEEYPTITSRTWTGAAADFGDALGNIRFAGASAHSLSAETGRLVRIVTDSNFNNAHNLAVISFSLPGGGSDTDDLTLTGVSVTPTVGLASLGQIHALSGVPLVVNPTIGLATLGQAHGLTATGISVATTVGDAVFGQVHALGVTSISVTPSVGAAALGQIHALSGEGVSVQPIVGLGSIIIGTDDLTLLGLSVTPTVAAGALGQVHGLAGVGLEVQPLVGAGDIGQAHALTLTGVVVEARVGLGLLDPEPVDGYLVWHLENQVNAASKRYVPAWRRR